jgi:site-specific DNA-methyltransferase (adenine-specific)
MKPYYEDEWVAIYHGDCLEITEWLEADVMITDPPYGVEFAGKTHKEKPRPQGGYSSYEDTPENHAAVVIPAVEKFVRTGKRAMLTPGVRNLLNYPKPRHMGAIYYPAGNGSNPWGFSCWQPILYYGSDPFLTDRKGSRPDSFSSTATTKTKDHPCPKPIEVMNWFVNRCSRPGELIADPFMGSGTTLVAAKALGRKAIGVEIEEKYCEIAAERLHQAYLGI